MAQATAAQQPCQVVIRAEIGRTGVGNIDRDQGYPRILEFRGNLGNRNLIDLELNRQVHTLADQLLGAPHRRLRITAVVYYDKFDLRFLACLDEPAEYLSGKGGRPVLVGIADPESAMSAQRE